MELEAPVKIADQSYTAQIHAESDMDVSYSSRESGVHTTPPETAEPLLEFLRTLATLYEEYSAKWFYNKVLAVTFMRRVAHVWKFENHSPYAGKVHHSEGSAILVRQVWRPEQLQILPRSIQIQWVLRSVHYELERPPGPAFDDGPVDMDSIPLRGGATQNLRIEGPRSRALRKVREARLKAAVCKQRAMDLLCRYYERYGTTEFMDGDSVLSSDEESTSVRANRAPP